ncbi:exonuclease domain-containing protein [Niabella drilacis]|uniref:DNA polymerase-3 subunit epsilon n=1 Tax=Niabella drilacis (strain DSM 25811 / CCM 8410 / CCUG 62505 / LMG 26954 / E90) TaxID=1285928 RepID=A0A1G6U759_NIADE|nr:exonuclease domain-containing protein [Niabella drilacis]SDD36385.1 DNA polymerase-3 subunit epsilon [Niabella drilacis]
MQYAIVDIETTGSYAAASGITEISIQVLDEEGIVMDRFESLVNPVQQIPGYIQALTGISNEMVEQAPLFEAIAAEVYQLLQDRVFVAHSVNFDYSFVKSQLSYCGYELDTHKLCTVRLSRKILPGHASYSLGRLCEALGITHSNKHRAGGDADATVTLFQLLLKNDTEQHILRSLKRTSKEQALPPNVPRSEFEQLPYTPGVYYFHDDKGKIVYVGKAKNIRYRVSSHFSNNSTGRQKQNFMRHVYHISYEECGTELMAAVKESTEIKRLWPRFNASQKRREDLYGIISYEDQNGYLRLGVDKTVRGKVLLNSFHHMEGAKASLRQLVQEYELCPRLCFIGEALYDEKMHRLLCRGACEKREAPDVYNSRVLQAVAQLENLPSFAIVDKGIHHDEKSCILVWKGSFYGMGFIPGDLQIERPEQLREEVTPYRENSTITNMLFAYAKRYPSKIIRFEPANLAESH